MRVEDAIANNIALYRGVLRAHGIRSEVAEHYWSSDAATPPYYSNLVTRTAEPGTTDQLARIRELVAQPPAPSWGLKDSFARLDLADLGLRVLFEARWYGLAPGDMATDTGLVAVKDPDMLARWEAAWQLSSPTDGSRVFRDSILDDGAFTFLAAMHGAEVVGGALLNLSGNDVGISNVFTVAEGEDARFLRDVVQHARHLFPERALFGYGPASEFALLQPLGFEDLGPLRVWLTP